MNNIIELPQFSQSTRQALRAEIVDPIAASTEPGAVVRAAIAVGTFIEATLLFIADQGGRARRNVVSFVRAIPLWISDLSCKVRWSRGSLAATRAARSTPERLRMWVQNTRLIRYPRYVGQGICVLTPPVIAWLSDSNGREDVLEARDDKKHKYQQAKETKTADAWKDHRQAQRHCMKISGLHGALVVRRLLGTPGAVAAVVLVLAMYLPISTLIAIGSFVGFVLVVKVGRVGAQATIAVEDAVTPGLASKEVTAPLVERAFTKLGVAALRNASVKCLPPGIITTPDGHGWKAAFALPGGLTAIKHAIPYRAEFASAIGGLDSEQVIMRKGRGENIVQVEVSDLLPSERPPAVSPYLSATTVNVTEPCHYGTDALAGEVMAPIGHATIGIGESGKGKSNGLYNLAAPYLLTPNGRIWLSTFKLSADLQSLLNCSEIRIVGDRDVDRKAMAETVRMFTRLRDEATRRGRILTDRGQAEVTPEMTLMDPEFYPLLCIVDEARFLVGDPDVGPEMKKFILGLAQSIRYTGIKLVLTTQGLSSSDIDHNFVGAFPTRIAYKLANNAENTTVCGNDAAKLGFDATQYYRRGQCVIVGDSDGLKACSAYHWTDEHKQLLETKAKDVRGGVINRIDMSKPTVSDTAPHVTQPERDLIAEILSIKDEGTFGDKGIWFDEFDELCELLDVSEVELRSALLTVDVPLGNKAKTIHKNGGAQRGFRFDHFTQQKEQAS